jgi:hypothetical protein
MANQRPRLAASEIETVLRAALQKLSSLRGTKSLRIRPYSGPKGFTWQLDGIEPEVGPEFADVPDVVARFQRQYDLDLSPPSPA